MNKPILDAALDQKGSVFELNTPPPEEEAAHEVGRGAIDLHVDPLAPPQPALEAPVKQWRVAKSLARLRTQINDAFPQRSKSSDGTIGDAAHASRSSDHNPWIVDDGIGVVSAFDVTHD